MRAATPRRGKGFTLAELAIVLLVLALLLYSAITTLDAQSEARSVADTQRTLEQAREAIIGFAIRSGRLPCPAAPGSAGVEAFVNPAGPSPNVDLRCTNPTNGFVPARTLGIGPTDPQGYLLDAWGNRVRYAVSQWIKSQPFDLASCPPNTATPDYTRCPAFTTANAMAALGFGALPTDGGYDGVTTNRRLLRVCEDAACSGSPFFTPAVIYSLGKNWNDPTSGASADEAENLDADDPVTEPYTWVARPITRVQDAAATARFDDMVIWISPNILYNRLVLGGS